MFQTAAFSRAVLVLAVRTEIDSFFPPPNGCTYQDDGNHNHNESLLPLLPGLAGDVVPPENEREAGSAVPTMPRGEHEKPQGGQEGAGYS
jgi:hypothetical protein